MGTEWEEEFRGILEDLERILKLKGQGTVARRSTEALNAARKLGYTVAGPEPEKNLHYVVVHWDSQLIPLRKIEPTPDRPMSYFKCHALLEAMVKHRVDRRRK